MLTARGDEYDRVLGFEVGADDYVVKPFSVRELVMRVKRARATHGRAPRREGHDGERPQAPVEGPGARSGAALRVRR